MRSRRLCTLLLTLCVSTCAYSQLSPSGHASVQQPKARASTVAVGKLKAITKKMTVGEVFRRIGPPARDIGSGIHVWEWLSSDGRRFYVGASDPRPGTKVMYARFGQGPAHPKVKRKRHG
jgi:hypothetical protein